MNENKLTQLLLDRLDKIDDRMTALENKFDNRMSDLEKRFGNVEQTTAWIKGKLEGRAETRHVVLTGISIFIAICAVVVAILK